MEHRAKKHTPIFIYDEVYQQNIWVSFGVSEKEYVSAVKYNLGVEIPVRGVCGNFGVYASENTGDKVLWIWTKDKKIDKLCHEAIHCTAYIFNLCGVKEEEKNKEAFAYYTQMIVRKVLENK